MSLRLHPVIAAAVILPTLAVLIQTFLLDGWLVPLRAVSGSMAPGIRGPHVHVVCGRCKHAFDVDVLDLPASGMAICPQCSHRQVDLATGEVRRGDRLLVDRVAYEVRDPQRWERVVVREPGREHEWAVKRIVGLPGERVGIDGGRITIDGRPAADQPAGLHYLSPRGLEEAWQMDRTLGASEYFLLGDNSRVSRDSRHWQQPVTRAAVIGRVIAAW